MNVGHRVRKDRRIWALLQASVLLVLGWQAGVQGSAPATPAPGAW